MLKNIDPLLGPALLAVLREMGHGDELAVVDANFPAASAGPQVIRADGSSATDMLRAILTVLPIDTYVDRPVNCMAVVDRPGDVPPVVKEFGSIASAAHGEAVRVDRIERFAFYERVKSSFAIIATGERRLYGNVIVKKGVIDN